MIRQEAPRGPKTLGGTKGASFCQRGGHWGGRGGNLGKKTVGLPRPLAGGQVAANLPGPRGLPPNHPPKRSVASDFNAGNLGLLTRFRKSRTGPPFVQFLRSRRGHQRDGGGDRCGGTGIRGAQGGNLGHGGNVVYGISGERGNRPTGEGATNSPAPGMGHESYYPKKINPDIKNRIRSFFIDVL